MRDIFFLSLGWWCAVFWWLSICWRSYIDPFFFGSSPIVNLPFRESSTCLFSSRSVSPRDTLTFWSNSGRIWPFGQNLPWLTFWSNSGRIWPFGQNPDAFDLLVKTRRDWPFGQKYCATLFVVKNVVVVCYHLVIIISFCVYVIIIIMMVNNVASYHISYPHPHMLYTAKS